MIRAITKFEVEYSEAFIVGLLSTGFGRPSVDCALWR